jgi:deoxyadenosine/deoxycytidine kinase
MTIFTIDGCIGCGKSTLLEYLHKKYDIAIEVEPIEKWLPFLDKMYKNGLGAFEFQVRVWLDRCWIDNKRENRMQVLMERSPFFQKHVFINISRMNDRISHTEAEILNEMYDKSAKLWDPEVYIYLRSLPEKCAERIRKRNRENEQDIMFSYLKQLHELHEATYISAKANAMPIICVDIEGKTVEQIGEEVWNAIQTSKK